MPGQLGEYRTLSTLGAGANYKLKLASHTKTDYQVVIKIMKGAHSASTAAALEHPNIQKVTQKLTVGPYKKDNEEKKEQHLSYAVLELCAQGPLFGVVAETGRLDEAEARYFFKQMVNAVKHAHEQGVAHGALKAENILMGANFTVKMSDFGNGAPAGYDGYVAPE
jgi:serine/threonine protein kinase